MKKGPLEGAEFPVFSTRAPTVIGRAPDVEVSLKDQRASRRHAEVSLESGRWFLRDLGSSNGTILSGRRVSKALLTNGALLQVGAHQLAFVEHELITPPAKELYGTVLREAVREDAGVFVCRGYQRAMDREVRVDWLHPLRCPRDPEMNAALAQAIEEARSPGDHLVPVLSGEVASGAESEGSPDSCHATSRGTWVILGGEVLPSLDSELDAILSLDRAERVALFRHLVERVLERASGPLHAYAIGLASIGVRLEAGAGPRVELPALDLGAFLAGRTGAARHLPRFSIYLAPEHDETPPADWRAALTYNLGALGHHLLTGRAPAAEGSSISEIPDVPADLAALVDRMLSPDPSLRPAAGDELLWKLREVVPDDPAPPGGTSSAATPEEDDILEEIEHDAPSAAETGWPAPGGPPGSSRTPQSSQTSRPSRPISRRHRATGRGSLVYLPLWILIWVGLFFAARYLSRLAFEELGL